MADPWTEDFAALGEHSRAQLRSIAATRTVVSAQTARESKPMRLFRVHPVVSVLLVLLFIGIAAPIAYAVVDRVFVSVDPSLSADELEKDLTDQLAAQDIHANIKAEKVNDQTIIRVDGVDPTIKLDVNLAPGSSDAGCAGRAIHVDHSIPLDEAQSKRLTAIVSTPPFIEAATDDASDTATVTAKIKKALADGGFHDVTVERTAHHINVVITGAPR